MSGVIAEQSLLGSSHIVPAMSGVRFDNTSVACGLTVASQSITNSATFTVSMFVRTISFTGTSILMMSKDVNTAMFILPGFNTSDDVFFNYFDVSNSLNFDSNPGVFLADAWHHVFMSGDANHASGLKVVNFVVDGVVVGINSSSDPDAAFNFQVNGKEFGLPIDSANLGTNIGDITDYQSVWIAHGQYVAPASVGLFRDSNNQPKDLGSDGSGPTGTAPTYYFQGNSSQFVTNKGSGSAVTVVGTPTDISP